MHCLFLRACCGNWVWGQIGAALLFESCKKLRAFFQPDMLISGYACLLGILGLEQRAVTLTTSCLLQGLYCISVNCMDNAEAQFTTALRVRFFFSQCGGWACDCLGHQIGEAESLKTVLIALVQIFLC